jgi:beta-galactosidase
MTVGLAGCTNQQSADRPSALVAPTVSLAGSWRFALDRGDVGTSEQWFARDLADKITLPGVLQAQGYGDEIRTDTPWVVGLGDAWWKLQPESLRAHFSQPGKVEVPFLSQPPRHYLGAAWYQREIEISDAWQGKRVHLLLERPHWETTVWVDDRKIGSDRSLVAPHEFDLGTLTPGKRRLSIRIDNRQIVRDPQNDGHGVDAHAVSDALGATWNGIAGRIELSATTLVWIEDAQVFPNVAKKTALIKVKIGNATGQSGSGLVRVGSVTATADLGKGRMQGALYDTGTAETPPRTVTWGPAGGEIEIEISLGEKALGWDEFTPAIQRCTLSLSGTNVADTRDLTFGLREVSWRGKDLLINGRVVNLRTTHFGLDFPLTGYPATDVESWKKIFRRCQEFGLNGMRFHSCCPPEAAFTAADELGFYLHPELGIWGPFNPGSTYTKFAEEETPKLLKAYGNHPSFLLLAPSNEPGGRYTEITPKWAKAWYEKDNRHLYSAGTGWNRPEQVTGGAQFATLVRFDGGELRNVTGWFGADFRHALRDVNIPVLSHEIGQWCAYPDFDVIKKFTGYLRPSNYDIFKYIAAQEGVADINHQLAFASGRFQLACYKEELEASLRTPGLAGHQMLDLRDYLGQGTALIGVLDAFWDPKSYVTAKEFRRFHGETVPLARLAQRTFTTAETLTSEVELYHFGEKSISNARPYWKIVSATGRAVAQGEWLARDIAPGKNIPLGNVSADLAKLDAPGAYKLVVGLQGTAVENDWNFWLYPAKVDATTPAAVLETSDWAKAEERLAAGGKVLFTPKASDLDPARSPPLKKVPVFWNIQMTVRPPQNRTPRFDAMLGLLCDPKHPALAGFPTEVNCDWQWTALIDDVRSVNLANAPRELKPIVAAIDDWNRNWRLGVIFECKVGNGRLLVSTIPLGVQNAAAGAQQLRRSLLDYASSEKFQPTTTLTPEAAGKLWARAAKTSAPSPTPRTLDPDLDDGSGRPAAPKKL